MTLPLGESGAKARRGPHPAATASDLPTARGGMKLRNKKTYAWVGMGTNFQLSTLARMIWLIGIREFSRHQSMFLVLDIQIYD